MCTRQHPALLAYREDHNILVEAYSPVAHSEILKSPEVAAIADQYSVTIPQLCISYTLQLGTGLCPRGQPHDMRDNAAADFVISDEDIDALRKLQFSNYGEHNGFPVYSGK